MISITNHIFDKAFKRILTLSAKSVISLINGLFDTDYPPDSILEYNTIEHVDDALRRTLADTIITVNHCHSYHMEAQMYKDDEIIFRVFDYGYHHALKHRTDKDILYFPEPVVIYLGDVGDVPENYSITVNFGNQGEYIYKVPACNFTSMTPAEIEKKNMVILLPFYILKLRKNIARARTPENLQQLKKLIFDDILKTIEKQVSAELLSVNDGRVLKSLLLKLYQYLYSEYAEMEDEGMNDMVEDALVLDIDVIEYEHKKELESVIKEKNGIINEKDRIISAYKLLSKGISVEDIMVRTGLSREQIESL